MSRCFPFPPPGYERKARPDDVNLIIKEKHKEKKHKKDKDKKERSEKKEKERSEDKHREKKDKKRKDKKDKKHKDKHKHRNSEEKKSVASSEHQNGEKLGPISELASTIPSSNSFVELQKRVENDSGATCSRPMVEESDKRENRRLVNGESRDFNSMGLENGRAFNFPGENRKMAVGDANQVENVEKGDEGKEKKKHKADDGKKDKHKNKERDKKSKSKDKVGEKEKEKEKEKERNSDMGEKRESNGNLLDVHNKASNNLKARNSSHEILGKRKEPEANGFSCDIEIPPHKLQRPGSSSHQIMQNGISIKNSSLFQNHAVNFKNLPSQSVGNGRKIQHGPTANHVSAKQPPAASNYTVNNKLVSSNPVMGISKKPTEPHPTANKVEKLKPGVINNHKTNDKVSTSPLIVESGGKMDVGQLKVNREVEGRGLVIKHKTDAKTDNKDSRVNGVIDPKQHASSSTSSASVKSKEKDIKPPHPDSKYLSQILTVPNVEWPEFDDQEWLFGDGSQAKRPKVASDQTEGTNVWAEAIPIESADVIALPYVIPY